MIQPEVEVPATQQQPDPAKGSRQRCWARLCDLSRRCFCLASHQSRISFKIAGTIGIATAANIIQSVFVMQPISGEGFRRHQDTMGMVVGDDGREEHNVNRLIPLTLKISKGE
jgi:hypothetical protein